MNEKIMLQLLNDILDKDPSSLPPLQRRLAAGNVARHVKDALNSGLFAACDATVDLFNNSEEGDVEGEDLRKAVFAREDVEKLVKIAAYLACFAEEEARLAGIKILQDAEESSNTTDTNRFN